MGGINSKVGRYEFPIYRYTTDRVESLFRRGYLLHPKVFIRHTFGDVRLELICKGHDRLCKYFTENAMSELQASNRKTKSDDGATLKPSVTVVHTHCYRLTCERRFSDLVLLTDCNTQRVTEFQAKHSASLIGITSVIEIKRNVDLLLERYACGVLKQMVDKVILEHNEPYVSIGTVQTSVPNNARQVRNGTNNKMNYGLSTDYQNNTSRQVIKNGRGEKRKDDGGSSGSLRSGKRFRQNSEEARHKLDIFLLDVMALFKRSDVPTSEWPHINYPKHRSLNRTVVENLFRTYPAIVACGYQHHILELFLDRKANYSLDDDIARTLKAHKINHYHFNYGPCKYTPLCKLEVGLKLKVSFPGIGHREATLGGFAKDDVNVYALVSRHFAEAVDTTIEYKGVNRWYTALQVETAISEGELDISALKLLKRCVPKDTRFKDSRGTFVQSELIDFKRLQEDDVNLTLLQGERIFAWTGSSFVRPSIGRITVPVLTRPNCQHNYVVIENENDEYADQGAVGPPVAESFGNRGDSGSIICFEDRNGKGIHVVSMFMGEMKLQGLVGFLTLPLQQGLQQVGASLGRNLLLC